MGMIPMAAAAAPFDYNTETQSAQAVAALKEAVQAKNLDRAEILRGQVGNDPLAIYADYWIAEQALRSADSVRDVPEASEFIRQYPGTYAADKVRARWVLEAANEGEFTKIREIGPFIWYNKQVRCAKLEARFVTGDPVTPAEAIEDFSPGQTCWSMLDRFVADGVVEKPALIVLLQDAIERNHTQTAARLAGLAFDGQTMAQYRAMMRSPASWVRGFKGEATGDEAVIVAIGLQRMARENLSSTSRYVSQAWSDRLSETELGWAWGQMAFRAALNLEPQADQWYRQAGDVRLSEANTPWRVRTALRQPIIDWAWVQTGIDRMPAHMQEEADWQYWRARALEATGQDAQAQAIYQSISNQYNFYGQLALEELGQSIVAPQAPAPITEDELQAARDNPSLQQAVALFRQGWRREAVPQWNYSLRGMSDRELMAVAEFAREQGIYDRVVNTSERTKEEVDFSQRFIAPFLDQVTAQAQSINLDPAWVYGLIRQESRFIMDARSVVGASGLMQLMPATAKYVAKKIGMTDFTPSRVNDFDVNTTLGTHYLMMVLTDLDNSQVLASAGYNAGPSRPERWRATLSHPVEGAIFAETIPFSETREYVKKVLSNATYYAATFTGAPQSLKTRLGRITPTN